MDVAARQRCAIPGCGRSYPYDDRYSETICGRHWKMGDLKPRAEYKRQRVRFRKVERLLTRRARETNRRGVLATDITFQRRGMTLLHLLGNKIDAAWKEVREDVAIKVAMGLRP